MIHQQQRMMQMNPQQEQQGNIRMQPSPAMSKLEQKLLQQQQHSQRQQAGMTMQRMPGPTMPCASAPGYIRGSSQALSVSSPALLPLGLSQSPPKPHLLSKCSSHLQARAWSPLTWGSIGALPEIVTKYK